MLYSLSTDWGYEAPGRMKRQCHLHEGTSGRGKGRALSWCCCFNVELWVQQQNQNFKSPGFQGSGSAPVSCPKDHLHSWVPGRGGAQCFRKLPSNIPVPECFWGCRGCSGSGQHRDMFPEEVIPSGWKDMTYFMAEESLGQESWVNPSTDSLSFYITSFQLGICPMSNAAGCFMLLMELQSFFVIVAECENQVFRLYSAPGPSVWAVPAVGPHTCGCWELISVELPDPQTPPRTSQKLGLPGDAAYDKHYIVVTKTLGGISLW